MSHFTMLFRLLSTAELQPSSYILFTPLLENKFPRAGKGSGQREGAYYRPQTEKQRGRMDYYNQRASYEAMRRSQEAAMRRSNTSVSSQQSLSNYSQPYSGRDR